VQRKNLSDLRQVVTDEHFDLGLATDGDADRFGIIDDRNRFVPANTILGLLAIYLKRHRNIPGGLARTVATTHLIDAIARKLGVPLYETPVGFKYIGELILADKIAFGGEESAGMSMYRHLPEKDGILACLLVAEMVSRLARSSAQLIDEMHEEFGYFYSRRLDLKVTAQLKESLASKLENPPRELEGLAVRDVNTTDGVKLIFDEQTWLLVPPLGHRAGRAAVRGSADAERPQAPRRSRTEIRRADCLNHAIDRTPSSCFLPFPRSRRCLARRDLRRRRPESSHVARSGGRAGVEH
jgi:phosphomannomutase